MRNLTGIINKRMLLCIGSMILCLTLIFPDSVNAATGINVQYHSQDEIKNYVKSSGATEEDKVTYSVKPITTAPYQIGALSPTTLQSSLNMLNQIRYIAGVDYDIKLDASQNEKAQAATLVNYVNGHIDHYPTKPVNMSEELYQLGYSGASASNLAMGHYNLNSAIVAWLSDNDDYNMESLGHRRWLLNPAMQTVGLGATGKFYAMYAFGTGRDSSYNGVCWPAQNMPVEYYEDRLPWSIMLNEDLDISKVKVTLTRVSDNKTWTFSQAHSDGYFNVDTVPYGGSQCIVFRPPELEFDKGKNFNVSVSGTSQPISYSVSFFGIYNWIDEAVISKIKDQVYNGKKKTPGFSVHHNGILLKKGIDYTVEYYQNKKIGKAGIFIEGKGEYRGSTEIDFKIIPKSTSIKKLTKKKKAITVKWKKVAGVSGYKISYRIKGTKKWKTKTVNGQKKTSATIKKLKSKKKYEVRIRTRKKTSDGNFYSKWSKIKTVKTR